MRQSFHAVLSMSRWLLGFMFWMSLPLSAQAQELVVRGAWVREAPPVARSHAAYGELVNTTDKPLRIVSVSSEDYAMAMLHKTVVKEGVVTMEHADSLEIPARGVLTLAPGGWHIMLMKPDRSLKAGDQVKVVFTLEGDRRQDVLIPVRAD